MLQTILVIISLFTVSAGQTRIDTCDLFVHPQYGRGRCIDQKDCANALYLRGFCESQPSNIQCCFAKSDPPLEEFRAAWVATVDNIDWPSARNLTTAQQQQELITILDTMQKLNMNAVIFHVKIILVRPVRHPSPTFRFVQPVMHSTLQHSNRGVSISLVRKVWRHRPSGIHWRSSSRKLTNVASKSTLGSILTVLE